MKLTQNTEKLIQKIENLFGLKFSLMQAAAYRHIDHMTVSDLLDLYAFIEISFPSYQKNPPSLKELSPKIDEIENRRHLRANQRGKIIDQLREEPDDVKRCKMMESIEILNELIGGVKVTHLPPPPVEITKEQEMEMREIMDKWHDKIMEKRKFKKQGADSD